MHLIIAEKRKQEIEETMLKARDAQCSVRIRYGKVLFCGAAAAGKTNFLNLLMNENFQPLHISTEVLKPQQVTIAMKAMVFCNDDDEVQFEKINLDKEISQLQSYLLKEYIKPTASPQKNSSQDKPSADNLLKTHDASATPHQKKFSQAPSRDKPTSENSVNKKPPEVVWDMLTFMDTGGQPQFVSMLPAVNSFAMITCIVHKMTTGGQNSLNKIVKVQYGNEKGEISYKPHPHKYTYLQLIETLISYASNILLPDKTLLDKVKIENIQYENRSILLVGTHSGDNKLPKNDITIFDEEFYKLVKKSSVKHIKPYLNKNYQIIVPVDNKKQCKRHTNNPSSVIFKPIPRFIKNRFQAKNRHLLTVKEDTRRYTMPSKIRTYIKKFLDKQHIFHVPIKWLLLEIEIRKVCQQRNCNLMSYDDVLKIAKDKKLGYDGEFGVNVNIDSEQFIKQGLRFHHLFGVLLYFEDVNGMENLVITNHQWLFNKLSKIVEYSFTCDTLEEKEDLKNGIFKKALLSSDCLDISKDFEDSQIDIKSIDPINGFLKLLEYLRIAAPLNENAIKYFMPCLLDSCELTDLKEKVPEYKTNDIEPLLIQFKSIDNETYLFPRGAFCFLVVELMLSKRWELCGQAYVNLLTLIITDTAHYITLIDRIFCLEIHVTCKNNITDQDEVRKIVTLALQTVAKKLKINCNLCHGFKCPCQGIEKMHISYLREENDKICYCSGKLPTYLTDSHKVWLKTYFKVCILLYIDYCNNLFAITLFVGLSQLILKAS